MAVRRRTAGELVALDYAGKAAALAGARDIDKLGPVEQIDQDLVAHLHAPVGARFVLHHVNFLHELHRGKIVLLEVALHRLGQARVLHELHQPDLGGVIAVPGRALQLRNHAGAGLQHGDRANVALVVEQLRHAHFPA